MRGHRGRYRQVTETLSRHGLAFLATDSGRPSWPPFHHGLLGHQRRAEPYTRPDHLRLALEELGPTFIKIGQILSTRPDLLSAEYIAELARLQDHAPAVSSASITRIVTEELGADLSQTFMEFDMAPLASASIGQVHAALLTDGTEVVVKVRRPDVVETVGEDLEILNDIAALAGKRWDALADYDVVGLVEEFARTLRAELDYLLEGGNAERFAANFAGDTDVHIPRVYWNCTSSRMLTLERVSGIKVTDVDALDAAGIDRRSLAVRATQIVCQMVFVDGFFHADPHPGNLFIEDDGRVALIDFGMVGEIDADLREQLASLMVAVSQTDADRMTRALLGLAGEGRRVDRHALSGELDGLLTQYQGLPIGEIPIGPLVTRLLEILRAYRIALPHQLVLLLKMLIMVEGMGVQLDPDFQMGEVLAPYAKRLVASEWSATELAQKYARLFGSVIDFSEGLPELLRGLTAWAEKDDSYRGIQAEDLESAIRRIERAGSHLAVGVLAAAAVNGLVQAVITNQNRERPAGARLAGAIVAIAVPAGIFLGWSHVPRRWYGDA